MDSLDWDDEGQREDSLEIRTADPCADDEASADSDPDDGSDQEDDDDEADFPQHSASQSRPSKRKPRAPKTSTAWVAGCSVEIPRAAAKSDIITSVRNHMENSFLLDPPQEFQHCCIMLNTTFRGSGFGLRIYIQSRHRTSEDVWSKWLQPLWPTISIMKGGFARNPEFLSDQARSSNSSSPWMILCTHGARSRADLKGYGWAFEGLLSVSEDVFSADEWDNRLAQGTCVHDADVREDNNTLLDMCRAAFATRAQLARFAPAQLPPQVTYMLVVCDMVQLMQLANAPSINLRLRGFVQTKSQRRLAWCEAWLPGFKWELVPGGLHSSHEHQTALRDATDVNTSSPWVVLMQLGRLNSPSVPAPDSVASTGDAPRSQRAWGTWTFEAVYRLQADEGLRNVHYLSNLRDRVKTWIESAGGTPRPTFVCVMADETHDRDLDPGFIVLRGFVEIKAVGAQRMTAWLPRVGFAPVDGGGLRYYPAFQAAKQLAESGSGEFTTLHSDGQLRYRNGQGKRVTQAWSNSCASHQSSISSLLA